MAGCSEFNLIKRHLSGLGASRSDVILGVGDDAAIVDANEQGRQVMALDTLVDGVHFPSDWPPEWVGYRALAVNLSDLAAMGAQPRWALLGLTLPSADEAWVAGFVRGLDHLAKAFDVALIGGDVTHGPLTISLQITGVAGHAPLRRDGAAPGDHIWVTGRPGEAAAGLAVWQSSAARDQPRWQGLQTAFTHPSPRLAMGEALQGIASAAIDISDGFIADAGHIAERSGVKLVINPAACHPSARLRHWAGDEDAAQQLFCTGGDDYELCFTAPAVVDAQVVAAAQSAAVPVRCVGRVEVGEGVFWGDQLWGADIAPGYTHFSSQT